MSHVQTVAVDFDGVIHKYSKGWHDGTIYDEPVEGALESLKMLMKNYAVYIHTSRDCLAVAEWLRERVEWCPVTIADMDDEFWTRQDMLLVTSRKIPAIAYIDDRAIRFTSWRQAIAELEAEV